jgi:hypothetical protein
VLPMRPPSAFRQLLSFLVIAGAALVVFSVNTPKALAANEGVTVIPPRFELFGNPGDTVVEKIRIVNASGTAISFGSTIEDFTAGDEEGTPNFINRDEPDASYRMAKWITVEPSRFNIPSGSERVVEIVIRIPRNAEPGGHFASVIIKRAGTESAGSGTSVESRIGSLVLMRVSGAIKEEATSEEFTTESSFTQYGPVNFILRTKNTGNVHVQPRGSIVITNIFGRKVATIPLNGATALPGSVRKTVTEWGEKNLIGRFTATLVAQYGQTNTGEPKTFTSSTSFIVFPLYLIWVALGVIVAIYLIITQRKNLKKLLNKLTSD